jgi:hypothetical protein
MVCNKRTFVVMSVVQVFNLNLSNLCYYVAKNIIFLSLFSYGIMGMNSKLLSEALIALGRGKYTKINVVNESDRRM